MHGFCGEAEVIVDLLPDGAVALAERKDVIRPRNAKKSDVKKILRTAAAYFEDLEALWEEEQNGNS